MRARVVLPHPAGKRTLSPWQTLLPAPCSRQYASQRIPRVSTPSIVAWLSLGVDSDERPALLPAHQQAARIRGSKAVLQVHRRTQALYFVIVEVAGEQPLQQGQIPGPGERAGCGRPLVAISYHLQRLRALHPKTANPDAQRLFARFQTHHGADHIPLFGPQMQDAAAMLGGDRVVRGPHLEEHTPILEQGGAGMVQRKIAPANGRVPWGRIQGFPRASTCATYQPMRADNWVTCAV